jgi:hypothetical protein
MVIGYPYQGIKKPSVKAEVKIKATIKFCELKLGNEELTADELVLNKLRLDKITPNTNEYKAKNN